MCDSSASNVRICMFIIADDLDGNILIVDDELRNVTDITQYVYHYISLRNSHSF